MAISFIGATEANGTQTLTIAVPTHIEGDLLLLVCTQSDGNLGSWNSLDGWTEFVVDAPAGGSAPSEPETSCYWRFATDSEPENYEPSVDNSGDGVVGKMMSFRGVDPTPLDQTSTISEGSGDDNPDPPIIETQTANTVVIVAGFMDDDAGSGYAVPSGYTDPDALSVITSSGGGNGCSLMVAYKAVVGIGEENPGTFTFGDSDEWGAISMAIRQVQETFKLEGVTKDKNGDVLVSCECYLFKDNQDDTLTFVDHLTSDGATGAYSFTGINSDDAQYLVVAWKDNTPHVFDVTDHVLEPVEE